MGQYYTPVLEKDGLLTRINPSSLHHWPMVKLMEHSWMPNEYLAVVANRIYKNPLKLVWLGDYGDEDVKRLFPDSPLAKLGGTAEHLVSDDITDLYESDIDEDGDITFDYTDKWLVNHNSKTAINFNDYVELSKSHTIDKEWIINPISLLTAIGNGKGGGDYSGINQNLVGEWAYCTVSIEDELPEGYTIDNTTYFSEDEGV